MLDSDEPKELSAAALDSREPLESTGDILQSIHNEFPDPAEAAFNTVLAASILSRWSDTCHFNYNRDDTLIGHDRSSARRAIIWGLARASQSLLDISAPEQHLWQILTETAGRGGTASLTKAVSRVLAIEKFLETNPESVPEPGDLSLLTAFDTRLRLATEREFRNILSRHIRTGNYIPWSHFNLEILHAFTDPQYWKDIFEQEVIFRQTSDTILHHEEEMKQFERYYLWMCEQHEIVSEVQDVLALAA